MPVCCFSFSIDEAVGSRISQLAVATFSAGPVVSIDCCVFVTLSIDKIFVATDAPFQDASNECWFVAFHSVLTRQWAPGFRSWLWREFSADPGASIDYCVFDTLSIEKIFVATGAPS